MTDPLLEAVQALRDTTGGKEAAIGRYTRSRVLTAVRLQRRSRAVRVAFGIPIAAFLIGSGAWAASGQSLPVFVQRVSVAFGLREPPTLPNLMNLARRSPVQAAAVEMTSAAPPAIENPALEPPPVSAVAIASSRHPTKVARVIASNPIAGTKAPRDSRITEQELVLYENAHRAHFVLKDAGVALDGWNEYLRLVPGGRFFIEARYNRALCLVRLGRTSEARQALEPFARGALGNYRKVEAAALLESLTDAVE